jgi:hypothetical protein
VFVLDPETRSVFIIRMADRPPERRLLYLNADNQTVIEALGWLW